MYPDTTSGMVGMKMPTQGPKAMGLNDYLIESASSIGRINQTLSDLIAALSPVFAPFGDAESGPEKPPLGEAPFVTIAREHVISLNKINQRLASLIVALQIN